MTHPSSSTISRFAVLLIASTRLANAASVEYNRDIRPIFSENCFPCHGFDEKARKGKLRLDVEQDAYAEHKGDIPIKPGDLAKSEAWKRITTDDTDDLMPPPKSNHKLTDVQKAKIKAWIEQGAKYQGHWSFIPPKRPEVPKGSANAIDALVHENLAAEGLKPSPEADRGTLIRRVSLDLNGLPPSAEEVERFINDKDPNAYEHLVDHLLQSPHYGERMALDWLDAARYSDTNGFSIDGGRHMWLWRDWVIQAFNDNKHYDRFLVEQLAGDLLPEHGDAELIATGFQRNNMVTHEGGTIPEENLTNYNADRVKTLGESVLGLTLGCAQCHNHKFDPITQKDYYSLFAFFNSLGDKGLDGNGGVNPGPSIEAKTVLKSDELPALQKQITSLEQKLATPDGKLLSAWETAESSMLANRGKGLQVHPVKVLKISTPNRGAGFEVEGENRMRLRQTGDLGAFDISAKMPDLKEPVTGVRVIVHPVAELPGGGWGSGPMDARRARKAKATTAKAKAPAPKPEADPAPSKGTFMLTALTATVDAIPGDQVNLYKIQSIARVTANSWEMENPPSGCLDPRNQDGWSPDLDTNGPVRLTATFAQPIDTKRSPFLTTQLNFGHGKSLVPQLVEISVITGTDDDSDLPADVIAAMTVPESKRTPEQQDSLWKFCAAHAPALETTRVSLANLQERLAALTQKFPTMVMNVAPQPRDTFILNRGDYAQPREKVTAATIASLPPMPTGSPDNRLGLAKWITMRSNPLTARVAVNRFWKQLFGIGIVATPADFGSQGEWPSHPDVLDWLAVEFMDSGWDVKHLVKLIVTSETYKQSSVASPAMLERDPQNRLLARGPRFRLPAELVRDSALKISGLLVPRIGGPSVNPYTPGDLWREISHYGSTPATAQTFVQDHGEKLYRRSLYTFWKRTAPPPNMAAFDAPNREICTIARGNTTTPLQALVTLNDTQFVEASRAFAQRVLKHDGEDAARLRWMFLESLSRVASDKEQHVLQSALNRERQRYQSHADAALAYVSIGESPRDTKLQTAELAAWSQVAALVLNLSESVTRN